jgi:hypothetical protein
MCADGSGFKFQGPLRGRDTLIDWYIERFKYVPSVAVELIVALYHSIDDFKTRNVVY